MDKIVALAKRRGFIFQDSEIYGGLANTWTYGPLGTALLRNIRNQWWQFFVGQRPDIYGIETPIIMNPAVWRASGHADNFADAMVECKKCHTRTRADHLIEGALKDIKVEGLPTTELDQLITQNHLTCPTCQEFDWTPARQFNLLFTTHIGIVPESESLAYLRGETAQGMFVNFKAIMDSMSPKLPFGIAQIGKAFRNEITKGNFIFRTLEFEQMEIEYFIRPDEWEAQYESWKKDMWTWVTGLGIPENDLRWRRHTDDELSFYSTRTEDVEYNYPFGGFKELYGLAYRTDYDLRNHSEKSGTQLDYFDQQQNTRLIPHVIEPTFGVNRTALMILCAAYQEDDQRVWLSIKPTLAPYQAAVFPLLKNKPELVSKAKEVYAMIGSDMAVAWDERGNIGKRYYAQDEIGTPWCITIDFDTLENDTITVRDRDTTNQERVAISELKSYLQEKLN
ncbi:glycine--tRNA ligase [candidate division WWE3 bacterium]|nr:glycine--tRNA ligase [candidate division WWE3 bacterium]